MFYSQFILAKKGPLGTIWIAAHLERKLRKNQVADTDIGVSVDSIISPDVPIALRLSSHLLVGVVRIYNRKVNYLFDDCSEALLKVKQAFRSTAVDLPPEESKAPYHSITLPETFDLDDFELPDNDILHGTYNDHHISSREQITLQDNMESVSYSTSKFGLDERFGDGDASGLDLDEEFFLEKIGTAGNGNESADPQSSVASMSTLKQDENIEERPANSETMVDRVDEYNGLMDYTEGPCTPGLVEEPNLSNVKEASACDDHLESEYHLESTMKENSKDISSPEYKQEENACQFVFLETKESTPHVKCTSVSESDKVEAINNNLESADNRIKASDVSSMEYVQDAAINEENDSFLPVNETLNQNEVSGEFSLEKGPDISEGVSGKDPSPVDIFGSVENRSVGQKLASETSEKTSDNKIGPFMGKPEIRSLDKNTGSSTLNIDAHDKEKITETPSLRACTTILEQSDLSKSSCSVPVDAEPDNVVLVSSAIEDTVNLGKEDCEDRSQVQKSVSVEAHDIVSNEVAGQLNSTNTEDEQVENSNKSVETELLAPEKLLSVPEGHNNLHKDMLDEFSPRVFVGHDEGDAGSKTLAGKKRTFTESTLTEQSLNSVESSRQVRGKRTVDSVPDDDDLLSSILVGRKSSVFKVKPTPRLSEVTSMKRTGSTQRSTAPKRKLLMDDTMVLHGDMIRQQLTSTEDIRRLRKKAPCTGSEISLIKKQHLDDHFFHEAVFTGMSVELASLHSQEYDLSRISVCQNKDNGSSLENLSDPMLASVETMGEPKLASRDDINDASIETDPHLTPPVNENWPNLVSERVEEPDKTELAEPSVNPLVSENRVKEVDCTITEVNISQEQIKGHEILLDGAEAGICSLNADAVNPAVIAGVEALEPIRNEAGDLNETGESNYLVNVDAPSVELDSADVNDAQAIGGDGVTEKDGNINGECETHELGERDIMMSDGGVVRPVPDAKNGESEYDVLRDVYNVAPEEQNTQVSELEDGSMRYVEDASLPEAFQPEMNEAEFSGLGGLGLQERDELNYSAAGNDTEFLNVDDDDLNEMADDHVPDDPEDTRITDNTGWSSRTRAVSKYLQTAFVKEADCGRKSLSIDNLLTGKSRKEASRMFFETLVLKTKDYVHVEQWHPFDNITIKPRTKLMKSDF